MNRAKGWAAAFALLAAGCASPGEATSAPPPWTVVDLATAQPIAFGGEGEVVHSDRGLELGQGSPLTGVTFGDAPSPPRYELEAVVARLRGNDFFCGLTFPTARGNLTLVLGGWGGAVCGLSSLDGVDAGSNETRRLRSFAIDQDHRVCVVVDGDRIAVRLDGEPFLDCDLTGKAVGVRAEVEPSQPFGWCSYLTWARLSSLRWRPLPPPLRS